MVSEWMDHGNVNEYIQKHGEVNRAQLVSGQVTVILSDRYDCRFSSWWMPRSVWIICMTSKLSMET